MKNILKNRRSYDIRYSINTSEHSAMLNYDITLSKHFLWNSSFKKVCKNT